MANYNYTNQYELLSDACIKNDNKVIKEVYYDIVMNDLKREKEVLKERLVIIEECHDVK